MTPGPAALCEGTVFHRRSMPAHHEFTNPVSQVWIDPDRPDELCDLHPAWSARRPAPARYRRSDYGQAPTGSLAEAARAELGAAIGRDLTGPVRMLSQIRRWGWLFNPITVFLVWDGPEADDTPAPPVGLVLEVTNTPWHERIRYPVALSPGASSDEPLTADFAKAMHVSPFLGMDFRYQLSLLDRDDRVALDIDAVDNDGNVVVHTALRLRRVPATREALGRSLRSAPLPTHRVSLSIHTQAARLAAKRVPFVSHPDKTTEESQ